MSENGNCREPSALVVMFRVWRPEVGTSTMSISVTGDTTVNEIIRDSQERVSDGEVIISTEIVEVF